MAGGGCAWGAPDLSHDSRPPTPQASAYLKQNKYQQAEELYREILSREDLPAPLGEPPAPPRPPRLLLHVPTALSPSFSRSPQPWHSW